MDRYHTFNVPKGACVTQRDPQPTSALDGQRRATAIRRHAGLFAFLAVVIAIALIAIVVKVSGDLSSTRGDLASPHFRQPIRYL